MIWAMGAMLLTIHAVPQAVVPASQASVETVQATQAAADDDKMTLADASVSDEITAFQPGRLALTPAGPAAAPAAAAPASPAITPVIATPRRKPEFSGRISGGPQKLWMGLAVAQHSAAAFDAWSTRRAITNNGARELNPMLKPFANNSSIYAATQVAPTLLDLLGRRMMTSRHALLRNTWWLPQVLGTAASIAGGVHNMGVR